MRTCYDSRLICDFNQLRHPLPHVASTNDLYFCRVSVERLFKSSLVPYTLSSEERMKSLLRCYCAFDEHSVKAFNEMLKTQFL